MKNGETINIMYSVKTDGWTLTDKAIELYNQRMREQNPKFRDVTKYDCFLRHDPLLFILYKELGQDFCIEDYNNIKICKIPKKYEDYYDIEEYDGVETITINYWEHSMDNMKNKIKGILLNEELTNDEKIRKMNDFMFNHF